MPLLVLLLSMSAAPVASLALDHDALAARIVSALRPHAGERVLIRFDPGHFSELVAPLRRCIREAGAVDIGALEYIESAAGRSETEGPALEARAQAFGQIMEAVDIYLWLPLRPDVREIAAGEARALQRWLDKGGPRREIHFHWSAGSVMADGLAGAHPPAFDALFRDALDLDYAALSARQDRAIAFLRSGPVRVRTVAGTDLTFRVGDRPFNKQDGDASPERMRAARVRVDREIELPAGVVRVAPLEESANGRIVVPLARFGDRTVRGLRLDIVNGRVTRVAADEGLEAAEAALAKGGEPARRFREFGLGFNPKLTVPVASTILPYYGYGAGVVRLSLGANEELGGAVRGDFVRWFFFPDATVEVAGQTLVRDGKLLDATAAR